MSSFIRSACSVRRDLLAAAALVLLSVGAGSCGGSSTSPTPNPTPTPTPAAGGATITITSSGVDKKNVDITVNQTVTFVNNDTVAHEMASNPHPIHTDCPPINQVGALGPGQSGTTGPMNVARVCGFHDHGQPTNAALQGTITIR
jgi:hypothetical protein